MLLKLVDRLVKEGNYAEALRILARASAEDPKNPYVRAYEARIRVLMDHPPLQQRDLSESGRALASDSSPASSPSPSAALSSDQRRVALLSKVAAILSKATDYLSSGDFQRAIEEVGRARMLDEGNPEIQALEQRIREARQEAEQLEELERARLAREQEEAHRKEMENLRREEDLRRTQEEQARRAAHEQKLNESLARGRALFAAGKLKEAQNELAFALVLDPNHHAARQLEQEISRAHEQALRAELQRRRQEEEERARAADELRAGIQAATEGAQASLSRGEFSEALDIITRAYVLDPTSSVLQAAEAQITAARDEAVARQREEQLARRREEEQQQLEGLRRRAEEEREALLRQREAEAEARRKASEQEITKHLGRARVFLSRNQFEAALSEVALAFVVDPFSEPTRALEQEILGARESLPDEQQSQAAAASQSSEPPAGIAAHLDSAREFAAGRDFAKAFDSIARAYAIDPLHPAVQECERIIQAAFVDYQGSLSHATEARGGPDGSRSASGRAVFSPMSQGEPATTSILTFDDTSTTRGAAPPEETAEAEAGPAWYRSRPVMYSGGIGALVLVAAVFLISSPSGKKPEASEPPAGEPDSTELVETREPPSAPVTLSEPQIFPGEPVAVSAKKASAPAKLRRDDLTSEGNPDESGRTEKDATKTPKTEPENEQPAETPAEPSVSPSRLDVASSALPQQRTWSPAPGPAPTPKAPEIKRLQQPRIPDAYLRGGTSGRLAVLVEIDPDGKPLSARVTRSTIPTLNDLFIEAVMASEFTPGVSPDGGTTTYLTIPFKVGE